MSLITTIHGDSACLGESETHKRWISMAIKMELVDPRIGLKKKQLILVRYNPRRIRKKIRRVSQNRETLKF